MTPKELEIATYEWCDDTGEQPAGYAMSMDQRRRLAAHPDAPLYFRARGEHGVSYYHFMYLPIVDVHTAKEITILSQKHLEQLLADKGVEEKYRQEWCDRMRGARRA